MIRRRFLLLLALGLVSCGIGQGSAERTIQGSWRWDDERSYVTWTFGNGTFSIAGYPPLYQEGRYRAVSSSGTTIVLHLFDRKGNLSTDPADLTIEVAEDGNSIAIDGRAFRKQN